MSDPGGSSIEHVSDTALWVANYRALESRRSDALFHDPLAEKLLQLLIAGDVQQFRRQLHLLRFFKPARGIGPLAGPGAFELKLEGIRIELLIRLAVLREHSVQVVHGNPP